MRYGKETDQETIIIEKVSLLLTVPKRRGRAMPCRVTGEAPGRSGGKGEEGGAVGEPLLWFLQEGMGEAG